MLINRLLFRPIHRLIGKKAINYILLLALFLRLIAVNQSLWLDEAIGALIVRDFKFFQIITDFMNFDNHPPLYYLDLKTWSYLLGHSDIALRLPSIIYGVLTVYLTYLIAIKLFSNKNRLLPIVAAVLLATSPFHIYYSQEARMYSLAAFLASLSVYSYLFVIDKKSADRFYWILFSIAISALVFTDYVLVFLFPVFWLSGFIFRKKWIWWKKFLIAHLPLMILFALWMPTFLIQAENGRWLLATLPAWRQVAGGANIKQAVLLWTKFVLGRISFKDKVFYYSLLIFSSIPYAVLLFKSFITKKKELLVWLWLILPPTFGFVASFLAPFFIYFRFLFIIPAFYLIAASGLFKFKSLPIRTVLTIFILTVNVAGWLMYVSEPYQQREHWKQAVDFVEKRAKQNEIVIFEYPKPFSPYRWYMKGTVDAVGVTNLISADPIETSEITKKTISGKDGIYYFEYLRDLSDPKRVVEKTLESQKYSVEEVYDYFPGVGQIFYWKKTY